MYPESSKIVPYILLNIQATVHLWDLMTLSCRQNQQKHRNNPGNRMTLILSSSNSRGHLVADALKKYNILLKMLHNAANILKTGKIRGLKPLKFHGFF